MHVRWLVHGKAPPVRLTITDPAAERIILLNPGRSTCRRGDITRPQLVIAVPVFLASAGVPLAILLALRVVTLAISARGQDADDDGDGGHRLCMSVAPEARRRRGAAVGRAVLCARH